MKIAILNDQHIGCRGDSKVFIRHQDRFFTEIFFPAIKERKIDTILHLGDIFDRRKNINFQTFQESKRFFFEPLKDCGAVMHTILGNHDIYYTNTNSVNSPELLLQEYPNIKIYRSEPVELTFEHLKILMCPWLSENTKEKLDILKSSSANILCGHFGLKGFEMMKGVVSDSGIDHKEFSHFEWVLTGHYHHPSQYGNIKYLGAQYEMNWSDYGESRGFYILDTSTRELEYIENPKRIHHKLEYDDTDLTIDEISALDVSMLEDCFVKVLVKNRSNTYLYDLFLDKLNSAGAADVKTVEDSLDLGNITDENVLAEGVKDTKAILHEYVDQTETDLDKSRIKSVIDELYAEALNQ